MKKITLTVIFCTLLVTLYGQKKENKFYKKGLIEADEANFDKAIKLFTKSIKHYPLDYNSWYNRGKAEAMKGLHYEALKDFNQAIFLAPDFKDAYFMRGMTKGIILKDYSGALYDFTVTLKLDSTYSNAFYYRGKVYESLGKKDSALVDYNKAKELGHLKAIILLDTEPKQIYIITQLIKTSDDVKYGFSSDKPVKVGTGPDGGPANNRAYLDLLRDGMGEPVQYHRLGSCCTYESKNSLTGFAFIDHYEIVYLNEKGEKKTASVYISFYDYEEPKILFGFQTVKP